MPTVSERQAWEKDICTQIVYFWFGFKSSWKKVWCYGSWGIFLSSCVSELLLGWAGGWLYVCIKFCVFVFRILFFWMCFCIFSSGFVFLLLNFFFLRREQPAHLLGGDWELAKNEWVYFCIFRIYLYFFICIFVIWCERPAYLLGGRWLKVCIKLNVPWQMVETAVKPSQRLNFHGFESYSNMRDLDLQLLTLMKVLIMMLMLRMDA